MLTLLHVGACGYTPVYVNQDSPDSQYSVADQMGSIKISVIPDREGQILRNKLLDSFYADGDSGQYRYLLAIKPVQQRTVEFDVTAESDITRAQLKLSSSLILKDLETNKDVLRRDLYSFAGYNILDSQYATRVSKENALENALHDMARQIELQVTLFIKDNPT